MALDEPSHEPGAVLADGEERRIATSEIQQAILTWFALNRRDLPWRHTRDPYRVLVAEVMLQQTQVERVVPYYERFLERFPDINALADAPTADVIRLWAGLGYNRRAVNLQRTAKAVVEQWGGAFPTAVAELVKLPGIGPYTAGAVACFAFEQDVAFLDTNIRRVVHRIIFGPEFGETLVSPSILSAAAAALVPPGRGWEWNQAMIEFGAMQCTARNPACVVCPVHQTCRARPLIQSLLASGVRTTKKAEGAFAGSNRYYRGQILAALRAQPAEGPRLTLAEIGNQVKPDYSDDQLPWLYGVVRELANDGLARINEESASYDASPPHPVVTVELPG